jgi:hypothetical protein
MNDEELQYAIYLANKGYPRALQDLRAQYAWSDAQNQKALDAQEISAQDFAMLQRQREAENAAINTALQNKTEYVSPGNLESIRQADLVKDTPFGLGVGKALGYPYELKNKDGEVFQRYDAQGNLTQFRDRHHDKWINSSDVKPIGAVYNDEDGYVTQYQYKNKDLGIDNTFTAMSNPRAGISLAPFMEPYSKDTSGFLGEGGWENVAKLALAAATAGFAAPAVAGIQGATGLGAIASGALYGGATGAVGGLLGGDGLQGALKGGALGAIGGGLSAGLGGAGGAESFPVDAGGLSAASDLGGYAGTGGMSAAEAAAFMDFGILPADLQIPALGGLTDVQATALMESGILPAEMQTPALGGLTDAQASALMESGVLPAELQVPAQGGLTDAQATALMESGILPSELQVPAQGSILDTISEMMPGGLTGDLIKGGLTLGGLAAAQALAPKPSSASTSLSAQELADMVAKMPSAMQQYLSNAGQSAPSPQSFVELFPGFSLPTTGPYFGAGRFGDYYAPIPASNTPISPTGLV